MRIVAFVLLAACGSSPAPKATTPPPVAPTTAAAAPQPVPLDQNLPVLATRATQLYQSVAKLLTANTDCAAATVQLKQLEAANADVVAANKKVLHDGRAKELRAALEPHATDNDAAAQEIVAAPLMRTCSQDRAFTDTFDELVGSPP
ncbi:MAG TPA: hypothetical protein VGM90_24160 [Kofleriaceae bacterium]|jgi:hypothetical protein